MRRVCTKGPSVEVLVKVREGFSFFFVIKLQKTKENLINNWKKFMKNFLRNICAITEAIMIFF